jgi:hypothetical protein
LTWEMPPGVGVNLACVSPIYDPHSHFHSPPNHVV